MALVTVVAAYDVVRDDRRARLAALLQAFGDRIQRSVFLLRVTPEDLADIDARASSIIDAATDSLYLMRQCGACWELLLLRGQAHPPSPETHWCVL